MQRKWQIPRRTFLKGLGTAIALPMLEAMAPPIRLLASGVGEAKTAPKRMAFVFVPNGANMADWTPKPSARILNFPIFLNHSSRFVTICSSLRVWLSIKVLVSATAPVTTPGPRLLI